MPTPPLTRVEVARRVAVINDLLARGHRPPGVSGTGPGAIAAAAIELGMGPTALSPAQISRWKQLYGVEPDWSLYKPKQTVLPQVKLDIPEPEKPTLLEQLKKGTVDLNDVAAGEIERLKKGGHNVHVHGNLVRLEKDIQPAFIGGPRFKYVSRKDNTYVFGATSDNHLGSKYERLDVLEALYTRFEEEQVDRVFNAGNWIDGEARFNKFDLHTHGMDNQLAYLAANYPKREGIHTYAVAGDDHEGWYGQREGVDIGVYAEAVMRRAGRADWHNLGYMEAHVELENYNTGKTAMLAVVHPGGGSAYALSYSIQKIIESLDGGEKPAVGLYGHYHKLWAGNIRNVHCVQTGCTEDQTPFMRKKKLEAHVGGYLIKLKQDPETGAIPEMGATMLRFFNRGFYNHRWSHGSNPIMPARTQ